nr:type II toxin-antitoxin system RelE/ParE family toxin [Streptomonospora sp. PA3]
MGVRASKELRKLDNTTSRRVRGALRKLGDDPRPDGCRKLKGEEDLWRIRVGDYRILYSIDDGEVVVVALRIAHRSDVYRDLD